MFIKAEPIGATIGPARPAVRRPQAAGRSRAVITLPGSRSGVAMAARSTPTRFSTSRRPIRTSICSAATGRCKRRWRRTGRVARPRRCRPSAGAGARRRCSSRRGSPTRTRPSCAPSTPRATAATWSSSIRPIIISWPRASRAGLHASTWRADGTPAAAPAEVARAARYYMVAQVENGHMCPITMTRAVGRGARRRARRSPAR